MQELRVLCVLGKAWRIYIYIYIYLFIYIGFAQFPITVKDYHGWICNQLVTAAIVAAKNI